MIEISPIVILDGKLQQEDDGKCRQEDVDYTFQKANDKSIKFIFKKKNFSIRFAPSQLINGLPAVWFKDVKLDYGSYEVKSYQEQGKAGVDIFFSFLPIKRLGLIPRVLMGEEEKRYRAKTAEEKRRQYEKDHPAAVKYWE